MKRLALISAALLAAATLPFQAQAGVRPGIDAALSPTGAHGGGGLAVNLGGGPAERLISPRQMAQNDRRIPLPQVISRLRQQTGGEYVSANVMDQGGRTVYWVRMRHPGGRFVDYVVDAQTGQIISQQGG